MSTVGGWLDAIAHLIVIGWLYMLTARVMQILTHAEQAVAKAAAVYEAVTDTAAEIAEAEPRDYVLVDNCAADTEPEWADAQLARFDFKEGHQR